MNAMLSPTLTDQILGCIRQPAASPSVAALASLVRAYTEAVPWESASRIARRAAVAETAACPRWPEQFWSEVIASGHGGTCFESNYAFFAVLRTLGYEGYLTINDMGVRRGCHTAIIVTNLAGGRWLADIGMPLYAPIPLDGGDQPANPYHRYTLALNSDGFDVLRDRHSNAYAFSLRDQAVDDATYRAAVTADYDRDGLFLDRVILTKVIDGRVWRFEHGPARTLLAWFQSGAAHEARTNGDIAAVVARRFAFPETTLRDAMERV